MRKSDDCGRSEWYVKRSDGRVAIRRRGIDGWHAIIGNGRKRSELFQAEIITERV